MLTPFSSKEARDTALCQQRCGLYFTTKLVQVFKAVIMAPVF